MNLTAGPATKETGVDQVKVLSVIIPAYNEEETIVRLLEKIRATPLLQQIKKELIVVDDCSSDQTGETVASYMKANPGLDIKYFKHITNRGKGASLHTGIRHASGDLLIIQDADLEYDPADYNKLLEPVMAGQADVVYGSRFLEGSQFGIYGLLHTVGNKFLTRLSNLFTGLKLTDMETCYKLLPVKLIKSMDLKEQRFGFEPELTALLAKIPNLRIIEVSVSYSRRTYTEGKKIGWRDGVRAFYVIIKYGLFYKQPHSGRQE